MVPDLDSELLMPGELETMKACSGSHSKNAADFTGDHRRAYDANIELCATIYSYYEKLEQLRLVLPLQPILQIGKRGEIH